MTPELGLAVAVGSAATHELKETRRLIHAAGNMRARLVSDWSAPEWPAVLEALCALVSAELVARGEPFGMCHTCTASVARLVADKATFVPSRAPRPDAPAEARS